MLPESRELLSKWIEPNYYNQYLNRILDDLDDHGISYHLDAYPDLVQDFERCDDGYCEKKVLVVELVAKVPTELIDSIFLTKYPGSIDIILDTEDVLLLENGPDRELLINIVKE